jgi:hypothetical protein
VHRYQHSLTDGVTLKTGIRTHNLEKWLVRVCSRRLADFRTTTAAPSASSKSAADSIQHVLRNPPQQPGRASGTNTLKFYTAVPECLVNRGNELFKYVRTYGGKPLYICLCSLNFSYGVEESELWVFYEGKNGFESALSCWLCSTGVVTYDRNNGRFKRIVLHEAKVWILFD